MRSWSLIVPAGVICLLLSNAPWTHAQRSVFSDEITVTATGDEEPAEEVPVPVTVIDRREIEDRQEESVADLLRSVPGVTVGRSGGEGSAVSLFTRGTESDHTLALFDGVRLNSPYFAGYDWSLLPTAGLSRVEVARGPFSALWGADAIGGVVNVVPMRASDGLAASLLGEGGEGDWRRLRADVGWTGGGFDLFASGLDLEGTGALDNSDFVSRQLLIDGGWSWGDGSRLAVVAQDLDTDLGIPFSSPGRLTPDRRQVADQRLVAVPVRVRAARGWDLEIVTSRVERDLEFSDPDDPFGFTRSETSADTVQARVTSRHAVGGHELTWGGEWREDEVSDSSSFGVNLDGTTTEVASGFLQDVWRPGPELDVLVGVRWDDADEWGSEVSPRLSFGWTAARGVEVRLGYGRAFRQPSVGELYFPFSGNRELEAERSESYEAGVVVSAAASRLRANLFATRIDDLIVYDNATLAFANVAEADILGAEAAWEVPLAGTVVSLAQVTWLDTEDSDGLELLRRPEWSASWTAHGGLSERLRGSLTVLWVGSRPDVDPVTFERTELGSHLTGDLSLSYEVLDGLDLLVRVRNLADGRYEEVAGYPAPGRRLTGGLRWGL